MVLRTLRRTGCVATAATASGAAVVFGAAVAGSALAQDGAAPYRDWSGLYATHCAVCHGERLEGAAQGTPLVGAELRYGDTAEAIAKSIAQGFPENGMPKWEDALSERQVRHLALYIAEVRGGVGYSDFHYDTRFTVPEGVIVSKHHDFTLETVIDGLDPLPYSIAPLPDGGMLLTEKKRGLSVVSKQGVKSPFVEGTPKAYADSFVITMQQEWGHGWLLDVAIHPDYRKNGWVYLHFGDRRGDEAKGNWLRRRARGPVSMNKVIRGRIQDGQWIDEQMIWDAPRRFYGPATDLGAGGRLCFDGQGHLFISVGMKGFDNHTGIQDLGNPWGKIHRVRDDGRIPPDNPFVDVEGAFKSVWTYGHRSPQGLEFNHADGELWGTEMGPRGGDEINRLLPGRNYGWPLTSKGLNYDGSPVAYGKRLGIAFDMKDIEQPVVDLTPSPAVSSFVFYAGDAFPKWRDNILVGALKARSLQRMVVRAGQVVETETLFQDLARLRDIEVGPQGAIYLLLEHNSGGRILRMTPAKPAKRGVAESG